MKSRAGFTQPHFLKDIVAEMNTHLKPIPHAEAHKPLFKSGAGFTLIEILVAMAIVGILASAALVGLSSVRQTARDTKRITDLRQVQTALELYYRREGSYPTVQTWGELITELDPVKIPSDPRNNGTLEYEYAADSGGVSYILKATLEGHDATLATDVDGTTHSNGAITIDCGIDGDDDEKQFCIQF